IGVVNEDAGTTIFLNNLNYGDIITNILVPADGKPSSVPLNSQKLGRAEAIAQVDKGKLDAAIIIPVDFSASLNPTRDKPAQTKISFYRNAGSSIGASIAASIVRIIVNGLISGNIADFTAKDQVAAGKATAALLADSQAIAQDVASQLQSAPPVQLNTVTI